jgi:hypothetical protein
MISPSCKYEIRVAEILEPWWSRWLFDMEITPLNDQDGQSCVGRGTALRGRLPDQAALFGLLSRLRDLNLTLLEVRRVDEGK